MKCVSNKLYHPVSPCNMADSSKIHAKAPGTSRTSSHKRKRGRTGKGQQGDRKRHRVCGTSSTRDPVIKQAVLAHHYPKVLTLRQYLLSKLPSTSKIRRKKILSVGRVPRPDGKDEKDFSHFLDQTLVGVLECKEVSSKERIQQWISFSPKADLSDSGFADLSGVGKFCQLEVWIDAHRHTITD